MLNLKTAARAAATAAAVLTLTFGIAACAPSEPQAEPETKPTSEADPAEAPETTEPTEESEPPAEALPIPDGEYVLDFQEGFGRDPMYALYSIHGDTVDFTGMRCDHVEREETGTLVDGVLVIKELDAEWELIAQSDGSILMDGGSEERTLQPVGSPAAEDFMQAFYTAYPDCAPKG